MDGMRRAGKLTGAAVVRPGAAGRGVFFMPFQREAGSAAAADTALE
jgi:hypothetical protein